MAIAALATSIAGPIVTAGLAAPVGLGLGIAGLVRTRRSGRPGKGMSIAAIVISSFVILLGIGLLVLVVIAAQNGDFDEATDGAAGHYTLRGDLTAGTCLDVYPETYPMDDARVVDCATAHGAEVVAQTTLPGPVELDDEDQPTGTVFDAALDECESAIVALAPEAADAGVADVYFSDPDRWPTQASAYCVLASRDADLHGSVVAHDLVGSSLSS
jgi:hypothetical protein